MGHGPGGGNMMMMGQKAKDFKGTLRRLLSYLKPRRNTIDCCVLCCNLEYSLYRLSVQKSWGTAITELFEGAYGKFQGVPGAAINFDEIGQILLLLAGLYVISSLFTYIQQYIMSSVAQKTVYDLREDVNEKLEKLPLKYFDGRPNGETLSRVTNDIDTIGSTLQQSLTQFITSIVTIVGIIIMMLSISPLLTLIAIVSLPISIFVNSADFKKISKTFCRSTANTWSIKWAY